MSIYGHRRFKFRNVKDNESRGKVKVYIEKGADSKTKHMYHGENGSPPYICFKKERKPSSDSEAKRLARKWANMNSS